MFSEIPGDVKKDSGKNLKRFQGIFNEVLGNVDKDSWKCLRRLDGL